jgi:hypothetical protein
MIGMFVFGIVLGIMLGLGRGMQIQAKANAWRDRQ